MLQVPTRAILIRSCQRQNLGFVVQTSEKRYARRLAVGGETVWYADGGIAAQICGCEVIANRAWRRRRVSSSTSCPFRLSCLSSPSRPAPPADVSRLSCPSRPSRPHVYVRC